MKSLIFAFCMGLAACGGCEKERPPPQPGLDKDGIQRRSDKVNDAQRTEGDRDKVRKAQDE